MNSPLIVTKSGNKTVGAHLRCKGGGNLFLLPYFDFDIDSYYEYNGKEDDQYWKPEAIALGKRLQKHFIEIDRIAHQKSECTPAPIWVDEPTYVLLGEKQLYGKLLQLENKIEQMHRRKESLLSDLTDKRLFKRLLYEKGKPLEIIIVEILKLMGFKTEKYYSGESEFDVVFTSKEGRFLGEVEGKDHKAINIDKLRQLEMNIHEDFNRDDVDTMAHGVLFGNAYRLDRPEGRGDFFTSKCLQAAKRNKICLVKTTDLFPIAKYLTRKNNKRYATRCRKAILNTEGSVVQFPPAPDDK